MVHLMLNWVHPLPLSQEVSKQIIFPTSELIPICSDELNLITVGFSKNFAKPPYSVDLYIRNINKNLFSSSSNIMTGQNISDSFFLSSWKMVGCASREGGVYVNKASNIIFSDVKLVCGFNSAPIASSSISHKIMLNLYFTLIRR